MLKEAVLYDSVDVVAFCVEKSAAVLEPVMDALLSKCGLASYSVLVKSKAIDIDRVIPWNGDILGIMAVENKLDWVRFCLKYGANTNRNLLEGSRYQ